MKYYNIFLIIFYLLLECARLILCKTKIAFSINGNK